MSRDSNPGSSSVEERSSRESSRHSSRPRTTMFRTGAVFRACSANPWRRAILIDRDVDRGAENVRSVDHGVRRNEEGNAFGKRVEAVMSIERKIVPDGLERSAVGSKG